MNEYTYLIYRIVHFELCAQPAEHLRGEIIECPIGRVRLHQQRKLPLLLKLRLMIISSSYSYSYSSPSYYLPVGGGGL